MFNVTQRSYAGALFANIALGASSLYWKQLTSIAPIQLLNYRIFLSLAALAAIVIYTQKPRRILSLLNLRTLGLHGLAALLIGVNWVTFIWASIHGRVVESGIGYLLAPFVTILISRIITGASLTRTQSGALIIIGLSTLQLITNTYGLHHWIYIGIGCSWGGYAYIKK